MFFYLLNIFIIFSNLEFIIQEKGKVRFYFDFRGILGIYIGF